LRLLYKAKKILPFEDSLLTIIPTIFPNKFHYQNMLNLAKKYPNIIHEDDFYIFYEELSSWKINNQSLKQMYEETHESDITSFLS